MAERGAQLGNQNAAKSRMFYDKLRLVLTTEPHRLRSIAEQLVSQDEEGQPWAIKEIIDRMDGKAIQATLMERLCWVGFRLHSLSPNE